MLFAVDGFGPAFWPVKRDIDGNITVSSNGQWFNYFAIG
jgi:hypothetical protein